MKNLFYIIIGFLFLAASCDRKEASSTEKFSTNKSDRVKKEIDLIVDSLNGSWNAMIKSDDQKLNDIKRLLQEISYTSKFNVIAHDSLMRLQKQLSVKRYDQETMSESKKIDDYDMATDSLVRNAFRLSSETPEMESHTITQNLTNDIMNADNNVVRYRANYDHWVREYNNYIKSHEKHLKKLGEPYSSYKKKPMFTISGN